MATRSKKTGGNTLLLGAVAAIGIGYYFLSKNKSAAKDGQAQPTTNTGTKTPTTTVTTPAATTPVTTTPAATVPVVNSPASVVPLKVGDTVKANVNPAMLLWKAKLTNGHYEKQAEQWTPIDFGKPIGTIVAIGPTGTGYAIEMKTSVLSITKRLAWANAADVIKK